MLLTSDLKKKYSAINIQNYIMKKNLSIDTCFKINRYLDTYTEDVTDILECCIDRLICRFGLSRPEVLGYLYKLENDGNISIRYDIVSEQSYILVVYAPSCTYKPLLH